MLVTRLVKESLNETEMEMPSPLGMVSFSKDALSMLPLLVSV